MTPEKLANRLRRLTPGPQNAITLPLGDPELIQLRALDLTLEEAARDFLIFFPELRGEVDEFFRVYGEALQDLRDAPAFHRLGGLSDFGIKSDPRRDVHWKSYLGLHSEQVASATYLHSRRMHSEAVAAHVLLAGLWMKLSLRQVAILVFAALLHDVGHPAFSHDGDRFAEDMGYASHEVRGQRLVESDPDLTESILAAGLTVAEVVAVMREVGDLGQILKVMDTLAYVVMDSAVVGDPLSESFSSWVIRSLTGVREERLQVSRIDGLSALLDIRARLSRDIYYHPRNLFVAEALLFGFKKLCELRYLEASEVVMGSDGSIEARLSAVLNGKPMPEYVKRSFNLAHGFMQELAHLKLRDFDTKLEFEAAWAKLAPEEVERAFSIEPYNYIKKSLEVSDPKGKIVKLQADRSFLSAESQKWYLLVWKED
ncbi:MAG: HD domain-containing protein [bacterium]